MGFMPKDDDDSDVPTGFKQAGMDITNAQRSNNELTLQDFNDIFNQRFTPDTTIKVWLVDATGAPMMEGTVIGLGQEPNTGDAVILVFPGNIQEWQTGRP